MTAVVLASQRRSLSTRHTNLHMDLGVLLSLPAANVELGQHTAPFNALLLTLCVAIRSSPTFEESVLDEP